MKHYLAEIFSTATATSAPMTRRDKLRRWAGLIRTTPHLSLRIYSNLERLNVHDLAGEPVTARDRTAFGVAQSDQVLLAAGLAKASGKYTSIKDHMDFFELTQAQLHEFSCDCGGDISNEQMARRIEQIADAA